MSKTVKLSFVYVVLGLICIIGTVEICAYVLLDASEVERELKFIQADSQLGWSNRPGAEGEFASKRSHFSALLHFDQRGLRSNGAPVPLPTPPAASPSSSDLNATAAKASCAKKILVIGDSTTVGMEVNDNETYASLLEKQFRSAGCDVQVFNGGVRGFGADQSLLRLRALLPLLQPDVVLFMASDYGYQQLASLKSWYRLFGKPAFALDQSELHLLNSPVESMQPEEYAYLDYHEGKYSIRRGVAKPGGLARWLRSHSFLFTKLDELYYTHYFNRAVLPPSNTEREKNETYIKILQAMKKESPRFFMTSFTTQVGGYVKGYDKIHALAEKAVVEFIDIRPRFEKNGNYVNLPDGHWNTQGHAQTAQALFENLKDHR